jgi:hypothetical protein
LDVSAANFSSLDSNFSISSFDKKSGNSLDKLLTSLAGDGAGGIPVR